MQGMTYTHAANHLRQLVSATFNKLSPLGCLVIFSTLAACSNSETNTADSSTPDASVADRGIAGDMHTADVEVITATDMMPTERCPDDSLPPCTAPIPAIDIHFLSPADGVEVTRGTLIPFEAQISSDDIDLNFVAVTATIDDAPIAIAFDPSSGTVSGVASAESSGQHFITINARLHPDVSVSANRIFIVNCNLSLSFDEALDPNLWTLLGDASRNPEGWLDTTNGTPSSRGVILLSGMSMRPDQLDVQFRVQATPAWDWMRSVPIEEAMSDGFAITFWNIGPNSIDELDEIISRSGNGMGYGVYPIQLAETGLERPESFTVEFDTYYNYCQQGVPGRWYEDPTEQAHVAITYNGYWHFPHHYENDAGDRIEIPAGFTEQDENGNPFSVGCDLIQNQGFDITTNPEHPWAPIPQLRDNDWHTVRVAIQDGSVMVYFDNILVLDSPEVLTQYKGGLLAFSGGSGAASAFYKFDDLTISGGCQ